MHYKLLSYRILKKTKTKKLHTVDSLGISQLASILTDETLLDYPKHAVNLVYHSLRMYVDIRWLPAIQAM